ncbi:envelope-like protein [Trifolium medium]|uniref:Envelope-like protein n=1 Tax=Trifolium medium TaxID=97028 RepID=A0A392M5K6_9FABA|nr:envelope-like protein [Trifolium medium]
MRESAYKYPYEGLNLRSDSESDVPEDALDIATTGRKKIGGKRVPENIPPVPLDNISFHSEENVQKWKYVAHRRIAQERELSKEALECMEVMAFVEVAGLMKKVTKIGRCYEKLVKEFIVNITQNCSEGSEEYRHVYVRGKCVKFSPTIINKFLNRSESTETDEVDLLERVTEEIIGGQVKQWPKKGLLSTGTLSVKYTILNRIGAANWK